MNKHLVLILICKNENPDFYLKVVVKACTEDCKNGGRTSAIWRMLIFFEKSVKTRYIFLIFCYIFVFIQKTVIYIVL